MSKLKYFALCSKVNMSLQTIGLPSVQLGFKTEGSCIINDSGILICTDGHHKLIRWRIVTHGGVDGYSRMVVFLKCSTNNEARTVHRLFTAAAERFGLPSRVRSDFGGENYLVARHMLRHRGANRSSMITGSSTHNQRIERLWVDMHRSVTVLYYRLFYFLEQQGLLDALNEIHLFALHYIYVPRLNQALKVFQDGWNHHGIRTANHLSPQQLFVQGALQLHSSGLTALDFFEVVGEDYGDDPNDPTPSTEVESVIVPEGNFNLEANELAQLQATVTPLQESDNYGIDLYLTVLDFLSHYDT